MDPIFHISNTLVNNTGIGIGFFGTRNDSGYGRPMGLLRGFGCRFFLTFGGSNGKAEARIPYSAAVGEQYS